MKSMIQQPRNRYEQAFRTLRNNMSGLNLPSDTVDELIEGQMAVSFEKGAMLFCEGNTDGMMACILTGYVSIYCPVGDGNRTLVRLAGPGEIIGYPDYLDQNGRHARMFEAQVATKCTVSLFSRDQILRMLAKLPADQLVSMLTALNTFWSENLRFFASLLNLPLLERLKLVLGDLGKRAAVTDSEGTILIPELGHEHLAEMIGCSRPMVSRMIAELVDAGLLARRGKQYVLLKNWDFDMDPRQSKVGPRVEAAVASRPSQFAVAARPASRGSSFAVGAAA
jgi:CRP/FNR family transcriptional regulator, cyclic AMP receptor protein